MLLLINGQLLRSEGGQSCETYDETLQTHVRMLMMPLLAMMRFRALLLRSFGALGVVNWSSKCSVNGEEVLEIL